jgi:integrase
MQRLTDNDDEAFHDYYILQKLGTLHLDLYLGVHRGRKRYTGGTGPAMEIGPIHERSKKVNISASALPFTLHGLRPSFAFHLYFIDRSVGQCC